MREQVKVLEHHSHTLSVFVQIHFFFLSGPYRRNRYGPLWEPPEGSKNGETWISTSGRTYNNDYLTFSDLLVHPV